MSKGEGQLIGGQGEQVSEFAQQLGFRQSLWRKGEDALTACQLTEKAALGSIEMHFEHPIAQVRPQIVVIASQVEPPVGADATKPATGRQVSKDALQVE